MATRAEIEARMADILNRTDFDARITVWFDRAYTSLQRRFDFRCMEVTESAVVSPGTTDMVVPDDIKKSVYLYSYDPVAGCILTRYRETFLGEVRGLITPICDDVYSGVFAVWYNGITFLPAIPSSPSGIVLRYDYYRYMTPVDDDWFMTRAEDYLVYRGLAESAPFLAADPRLAVWQAFAKEAYDELWKSDLNNQMSGPMALRG